MGEVDNMTLYELLQYADKEIEIAIKDSHKAVNLERRMCAEARRSYPKGISSLQEYAEIWRDRYEIPYVYSISYDYIKNIVVVAMWRLDCVTWWGSNCVAFADGESARKFRDENLEELEWYFKEYKKL